MRKTVKLQIEMSEKREKINALLGKEEGLSDEERAELDALTKRAQEIEIELRAALVVDSEAEERAPRRVRRHPGHHPRGNPRDAGTGKDYSPLLPWRTLLRQPSPIVRLKARPPSFRSIWVSAAIKSRWSCSKFAPQPIPRRPRTASPISSNSSRLCSPDQSRRSSASPSRAWALASRPITSFRPT